VALDGLGRPLAGAKISVCDPVYVSACLVGQTGSDGRYHFDLPPDNAWKVYGSITKPYNGKSYCLELRPDSTDAFGSSQGAVRNFEWKLTGRRPDKASASEFLSYYGAGAAVAVGDYNNPVPLQHVKLNFVPQGPLADGSAGASFIGSAGDWTWNEIGDVPLGRYAVTAEYAPPGSAKSALLVGTSFFQYAGSAVVDFEPPAGGICTNSPEAKIYVAFP
jgi:hypothetical protein